MHAVNANGVPVIIAAQPMPFVQDHYSTMRNDYAKLLIIFGSLQIVFGGLSIIFEAVSVGIYSTNYLFSYALIGYGFWTGIFFIINGSFGVVSGKQRNGCCVITFNVLSIISACMAGVLLSLAIISAYLYGIYSSYGYYSYRSSKEAADVGIAMESLMAIIAVPEAIVAIWSSVICCKIGACCRNCGGPPSTNAPYVQITMTGQQPYPIIDNGYNQQPQPQTVIAHPMAYGQQNMGNDNSDNSKMN